MSQPIITMENQTSTYRGKTKYNEETARKYQSAKLEQHGAEMRLVDWAFGLIPKSHRVLDVPCGGGRVTLYLARKGYWMSCADYSEAMLQITRELVAENKLGCTVEKQDVERLTYADRAFDTVFNFRLFHHFPNAEVRQRVVSELCRVAGKYVVLSYLSAASVTGVKRRVQAALGGQKSSKHTTSLSEVKGYFEKAGFRLVKDFARAPIIHTLHVAVFERAEGAS